jgi:hypothetical protein
MDLTLVKLSVASLPPEFSPEPWTCQSVPWPICRTAYILALAALLAVCGIGHALIFWGVVKMAWAVMDF